MADASTIANALHPGIAKLRQQLAGLLPDKASALSATADAARPTLLQQAMDNAPMLMEAGTMLLRLIRGTPDAAVERHAPPPAAKARRTGLLRPVLIVVAVAGTAYLVSRALRPATGGQQAARRR